MADLRDLRVSLKFSEKDGDHLMVSKLLKQLGRKKSSFIVKAVKYYMENNPMPEIPGSNPVVTSMVTEAAIRATIFKMLQAGEIPSSVVGALNQQNAAFKPNEQLQSVDNKQKTEKTPKAKPARRVAVKVEDISEDDYLGDKETEDSDTAKKIEENAAVNNMLDMLNDF